jgi:hypothetical protein
VTQLRLNPPLEVWVESKGYGWALIHLDYGATLNGCFLVAFESDNSLLYIDVIQCKVAENYAYGWKKPNGA